MNLPLRTSHICKNWSCLLALILVLLVAAPAAFGQQQIGAAAAAAAAEAGPIVHPENKIETIGILFKVVQALVLVLLVLVVFLTSRLARLVGFDPFRNLNANLMNARMFLVFGLAFAGFVIYELKYHAPFIVQEYSTKHGEQVYNLLNVTIVMTGLVFIITQALLFFYSFRYQSTKTRKALYYPDNHKLELIWTLIPAVALAVVVLFGVKVWNEIHNPELDREPLHVEVTGEQFRWTLRYAGDDAKLGKFDYAKIASDNPLGMDSLDLNGHDDKLVFSSELHLPVNRPVTLHARAKDVLHGLYIPHFAVNVYAVPGMPTSFTFTPTVTTEEMRRRTGNPKFNYELACGQLCGSSHYNMRVVVIVEEEAAYSKWLAEQAPWMNADKDAPAQEAPKTEEPAPTAQQNETAAVPATTVSMR
jgi:cytochrome c oxidase subunit 2